MAGLEIRVGWIWKSPPISWLENRK